MQPQSRIAWCAPVQVAAGRAERGPWRQNDSRYDYVDDPTVALDAKGVAYVAWVDQRRKDVLFQVFEPNGKPRLNEPVNVSRTPRVFSWLPRVAVSPKEPRDLYVLWQEIVFSGGSHGGDIFFARSRDGGATFEKPRNLSRSVGGDGKGRINKDIWHNGSLDIAVADDGAIYAAWSEYEGPLWFSRSTDRGASFSRPLQLGELPKPKPARAPALAAAPGGRVYLAWPVGDDTDADVRIAHSTDAGLTFTAPRVVEQTSGYSDAPKIALDAKGTLHLVLAQSAAGPFDRYHVRYLRSTDRGRTFAPGVDISSALPEGQVSAGFPSLALDRAGNVFVLWEVFADQRMPPRGLALAVSRDGGATFATPDVIPASADPEGGFNGSLQGLLMRKLAVDAAGDVAVVNSSFNPAGASRVWLTRSAAGDGKCPN